jgi:ribonuclease HI
MNNMAEAHGLFMGLTLAKAGGFKRLQVEGDSLIIINNCIKRDTHSWQLGYIFRQIWFLLDSFDEIYISHTLREGNAVADYLANIACDGQDMMSLAPAEIIKQDTKLEDLVCVDMTASSS